MKKDVFAGIKCFVSALMFFYFVISPDVYALDVDDFTPETVLISGVLEIEAAFENNDVDGEDTSDITLATAEVGIEAKPVEWLTGFALLSWEDDDEKIIFDEAHITLGASEEIPYYLQAGKLYVPFGVYETNMISDPLTLELGEIVDTAVQVAVEMSGFRGSIYFFNGETDEANEDDKVRCFGASVGYSLEGDVLTVDVGGDWINNILESGPLNEMVRDTGELEDYVGGYGFHANLWVGPFSVFTEIIAATDDIEFAGMEKKEAPMAWAVEAGYTFEVVGRETTVALGYQATDEAVGILPESRILGSVGVGLSDSLSVALECSTSDDYARSDGGSDEGIDILTLQLALEF